MTALPRTSPEIAEHIGLLAADPCDFIRARRVDEREGDELQAYAPFTPRKDEAGHRNSPGRTSLRRGKPKPGAPTRLRVT